MAVTDQQRRQLYTGLVDRIGQENADTLMELLPPFDWGEFATKSDIAELRTELRGEMAELRGEMAELRGEVRSEISELRGEMSELRGEIVAQGRELKADLFEHTAQLQRTYATWLFASLGVVLAAVGAFTAIG